MNNTNLHDLAEQFASESARNEAEAFENAMSRAFKPKDEVEQAFRQGYAAGVKSLEEKHWDECRQIAHYEDENRKLKQQLEKRGGDNMVQAILGFIAGAVVTFFTLCFINGANKSGGDNDE